MKRRVHSASGQGVDTGTVGRLDGAADGGKLWVQRPWEASSPPAFLLQLQDALSSHNFKQLQQELSAAMSTSAEPAIAIHFVLKCLAVLISSKQGQGGALLELQSPGVHPQSQGVDPQSQGMDPQSQGVDPQSQGVEGVGQCQAAGCTQQPTGTLPAQAAALADDAPAPEAAPMCATDGNTKQATPADHGAGAGAAPPAMPANNATAASHASAEAEGADALAEGQVGAAPGPPRYSPALGHLLVELLPASGQLSEELLAAARPEAVELLLECVTCVQHARLALKLAQVFKISSEDLPDFPSFAVCVLELLEERNSLTPAMGLVMHFQGLYEYVDRVALLRRLLDESQEALAERWAATLAREDQVAYVEACLACDRLKAASRAVRAFGLKQDFPDVESQYRRASVARLVGKRLWGVAASFVGGDPTLQRELLLEMVAGGEALMAEEYRRQFGLPEGTLEVDAAAMAAQEAARAAKYLQLELGPQDVLFVADAQGLAEAARRLAGAPLLGLDVEWKPNAHVGGRPRRSSSGTGMGASAAAAAAGGGSPGGAAAAPPGAGEASAMASADQQLRAARRGIPASILQLASQDVAVLFDLIALCDDDGLAAQLDAVLAPLFGPGSALVLGFELAGDLAKLHGSYPHVGAFSGFAAVLDLKEMWRVHAALARQQQQQVPSKQARNAKQQQALLASMLTGAGSAAPPVGLSTLAAALLGKPLDKSMQVSDWEARPLSARQVRYAAQDAHVLLRLWHALRQAMGEELAQQVVQAKTFSSMRGDQATRGPRKRARSSDSGNGGDGGGGSQQ